VRHVIVGEGNNNQILNVGWSSPVARQAHNLKVGSSSLPAATKFGVIMSERGSDRTTKAMREAPRGAIYVWCGNDISYAKDLALHLVRDDLIICRGNIRSVEIAAQGTRHIVVVDHARHAFNDKDLSMIEYFAASHNRYVEAHKESA
jgi:hypothetical protein